MQTNPSSDCCFHATDHHRAATDQAVLARGFPFTGGVMASSSEWIKYCKDLPSKPQVGRIQRLSGRSNREVVAILLEFWAWADGETADGKICPLSVRDLCGLFADTDDVFWDAVQSVGWIAEDGDSIVIADYAKHMDRNAKTRAANTKRMQQNRNNQQTLPKMCDSDRTSSAQVPHRNGTEGGHSANEISTKRENKSNKKTPTPFPPQLDTETFRAAWGRWEKYRREAGKKLTPSTISRQLDQLNAFGLSGAIVSIDQSIAAGWTGLFAPKAAEQTARDKEDWHERQRQVILENQRQREADEERKRREIAAAGPLPTIRELCERDRLELFEPKGIDS